VVHAAHLELSLAAVPPDDLSLWLTGVLTN
jgi:hypothetical protein